MLQPDVRGLTRRTVSPSITWLANPQRTTENQRSPERRARKLKFAKIPCCARDCANASTNGDIYIYINLYRQRKREREREKAFGKRRPKLQTHSRGIRHRLVLDSCHFWLVLEHGRSSSFWNACLLCRFVAFFFAEGFLSFWGKPF